MDSNHVSIYPVPWDLTTSFRHGTCSAPQAIQSVLNQLDDFHPFQDTFFDLNLLPVNRSIVERQSKYVDDSRLIISSLNRGLPLTGEQKKKLNEINIASTELHKFVYNDIENYLSKSPIILCGGEHGSGLGYLTLLADQINSISILHIDAHMDCRHDYLGFEYSHASAMTHYEKLSSIHSITQVGIRDFSIEEKNFQLQSNTPFHLFLDYEIHKGFFNGKSWHDICSEIINSLGDSVFISLDVDGLVPYLGLNTGTPVPGGISFNQLSYLFELLYKNKRCIGAELVEVNSNGTDSVDAIFGARLLHLMAGMLF